MKEDDITYDEHVAMARRAEINNCRLIYTDNLAALWSKYMPPESIQEYVEEQYEMMMGFCKNIIMAEPGMRPDYEEFVRRAYQLFLHSFKNIARNLPSDSYNYLYQEFLGRLVINLNRQEDQGEEYDFRTLVLVVDVLPQGMEHDPRYEQFNQCRYLHERKVNLLH